MKAYEKETEKKAWDLYVAKYIYMDRESYVSFNDFYKPKKQFEEKSVDVILSETREILNSYSGGDRNRTV